MNKQKPEASAAYAGGYIVHSIFHTIQGEGPFSGDAAVFVRLAGCNLQCPFCDTDYTRGPRLATMTAAEIKAVIDSRVLGYKTKLAVITGGEPFRQDVYALVDALLSAGYNVQFETNGTLSPSDAFKQAFEGAWSRLRHHGVTIVVSPKAQFVDPWIANQALCYKYVLSHDSIDPEDGLPVMVLGRKSQRVARTPYAVMPVYVSPCDPAEEGLSIIETHKTLRANHRACLEAVQKFGYRLQIQIHKYLEVE